MKRLISILMFVFSTALYCIGAFLLRCDRDHYFYVILCITVIELFFLHFALVETVSLIKGKKITDYLFFRFFCITTLIIIASGLFFCIVRGLSWVVVISTYLVLTIGYSIWYCFIIIVRKADSDVSEANNAALEGKKEIVKRIRLIDQKCVNYDIKKRLRVAENFAKNISIATEDGQIDLENEILSVLDSLETSISEDNTSSLMDQIDGLILLIKQRRG